MAATLELRRAGAALHVTLNQPQSRNALSAEMVAELQAVAAECAADAHLRCVVLRGAGGNFCAGGNLADFQRLMRMPREGAVDPIATANREFGRMLQAWHALPQVVVAVVEGAAMGGGFGLAAISDICLAETSAQFAMPETSLGLPPAQIAPFVALRIGQAATRRLALTASRIGAQEARAAGLVDEIHEGPDALAEALGKTLRAVLRCAPGALRSTKAIVARAVDLDQTLDFAAGEFAHALRGGEAAEGVRAFGEKRSPAWVEQPA
ncbi:enoyl-CoA hydratase/isomerase family protein [Noviherbaspirillum sp.]|uniref:enoyl-CoA hydratase/isomerase family protein n=1 Tax=Noviherbaspirillum sp. TaxID=1926288 RepID=UPI002D3E15EC|nr:enoyl-CoA hydratase-related protein [Noviherbaspirillum sp.]HZW19720.1 enoyl-CoA hydratase-related protein [Noviherbaspirillum sp.]